MPEATCSVPAPLVSKTLFGMVVALPNTSRPPSTRAVPVKVLVPVNVWVPPEMTRFTFLDVLLKSVNDPLKEEDPVSVSVESVVEEVL